MSSESLVLFFIIGVVLVGGAILFSTFFAPKSSNSAKLEPYECGIPVKDGSWIQFNVGYYLFSIIYLVFDVEIVFIYPWGTIMKEMTEKKAGMIPFVEMLIFFVVLGLGLAYAWKKKALKWV